MTENRLKKFVFNESTPISLSLALVIVAFGYFLGEVTNTANANTSRLDSLHEIHRQEMQFLRKEIMSISTQAASIDGKIDVILYDSKKKRKR